MGRNAESPIRLIIIYINYEYIELENKEHILCYSQIDSQLVMTDYVIIAGFEYIQRIPTPL
jgi:hypothetical protein